MTKKKVSEREGEKPINPLAQVHLYDQKIGRDYHESNSLLRETLGLQKWDIDYVI